MKKNDKIYVTGHTGLVGSAVMRKLHQSGFNNILTISHTECDLRDYGVVDYIIRSERPYYVINCAGRVGGINANSKYGGDFIYDNLMMQTNLIHVSHLYTVKKFVFLGSSCIYPKNCPQPVKEEYFMSDYLEETNKGYAVAKIAGITMCQMYYKQFGDNFISVMPTNLYGEGDNFNLHDSHAMPAMIRKFYEAKLKDKPFVEMWGTGEPRREFLYVDDVVDAIIFLIDNYDSPLPINIGTGTDMSIRELANIVKDISGYEGAIKWNTSYPDGTRLKRLDTTRINKLGWTAKTGVTEGITKTYRWFAENYDKARL